MVTKKKVNKKTSVKKVKTPKAKIKVKKVTASKKKTVKVKQPKATKVKTKTIKKSFGKELGVIGFILSMVSIFTFWMPYLGLFLLVAALVLTIIQISKRSTGLAIAGLVVSILLIIPSFAITMIFDVGVRTISDVLENDSFDFNEFIVNVEADLNFDEFDNEDNQLNITIKDQNLSIYN